MLIFMLLRRREEPIFDQTRAWIESRRAPHLQLIVDELHLYRGTQGSEVAYLLADLLERLGLHQRPRQVRFIAASASLEGERDRAFLEGFFAAPAETFEIIRGELADVQEAPASRRLAVEDFRALSGSLDDRGLDQRSAVEFCSALKQAQP